MPFPTPCIRGPWWAILLQVDGSRAHGYVEVPGASQHLLACSVVCPLWHSDIGLAARLSSFWSVTELRMRRAERAPFVCPSYFCSRRSVYPPASLILAPACLMPLLTVPGGHTTHKRMVTRCDSTGNSGCVLCPGQSSWRFIIAGTVMPLRAASLVQVMFLNGVHWFHCELLA